MPTPHNHFYYIGEEFLPTVHRDTYPAIDPTQWDLTGRTVVITGASRGIGRSIAVSFAKAGASHIALLARSESGLEGTAAAVRAAAAERASSRQGQSGEGERTGTGTGVPDVTIIKVVVDLTDDAAVSEAARQVRDALRTGGRVVDVLVNNAGYIGTWAPIAESDPGEWWKVWELNTKGTYLVTRAFLPLILGTESGKEGSGQGLKTIVNVASAGAHMLTHGASAYQMGKLAMLRFTEFLAVEYGPQGLFAIAVHPGSVLTNMGNHLIKTVSNQFVDTPELAGDTIVWLTKERKEWLQARFVDCCWDIGELEVRKDEIVEGDKLKVKLVV